ncbi:hypothetical protein AS28_03734, partial [Pygoscelis adeliae]
QFKIVFVPLFFKAEIFFDLFSHGSTQSIALTQQRALFLGQLGQPNGSPPPKETCLITLPHQIPADNHAVLALVSILILASHELIQVDNPARNCFL